MKENERNEFINSPHCVVQYGIVCITTLKWSQIDVITVWSHYQAENVGKKGNSTHRNRFNPQTPCIFNPHTTRVRFMLHVVRFTSKQKKAEQDMKYSMEDTISSYRTLFLKALFDNSTMHEFVRWPRGTVRASRSLFFFSILLSLFSKRKKIIK